MPFNVTRGQVVALGATGLALTAGAIAAGVALSNKTTRRRLTTTARKGLRVLKEGARRMQAEYQRYQPAALRITRTRTGTKRGRKRTKKATKN